MDAARRFQDLSIAYFEEYLGKIRTAIEPLSEEETWWRSNAASNSIGNLLLHLRGNLTQWVLDGLGGRPFDRHRAAEFAAGRDPGAERVAKAAAFDGLAETIAAVIAVIDGLAVSELDRVRRIQTYDLDGWKALYHVVEHMSYHTGQIVLLAKQLRPDAGVDFYPQHRAE